MGTKAAKLHQPKRRIMLVDDHPIVREGLAQILNQQADMEVCGQCDSAQKAIELTVKEMPDLVIVDISLDGANGIELIKNLRAVREKLPVLTLSMHEERLYAERALRAGASGYVMKQAPVPEVLKAVRQILGGGRYLSAAMQERLVQLVSGGTATIVRTGLDTLTDREIEVFELVGGGLSTREIAGKLHIGAKTVETYRAKIKEKLGLRNAAEVLRAAIEFGNRQVRRGSV